MPRGVYARAKSAQAAIGEVYERLKLAPCTDCGQTFPVVCMDFDHRPGTKKVAAVSQMVRRGNLRALLDEVAKCDLVCANCHRIRTKSRGHSRGKHAYLRGIWGA